jgi:sugar lactone lactonase YvrE
MSFKRNIFCYLSFFLLVKISCIAQFEEFCLKYDTLSTVAGKGDIPDKGINGWLSGYEGGSALAAELSRPHFAMADGTGNIYIADKDAHAIRKVNPDGIITTFAGTGVAGDNGDGPGTECQLSSPNGLWVMDDGSVYILDLGNNYIRKLNTNGNLTTVFKDSSGIAIGRGLWVSPGEDLIYYASSSKVKKWTTEGGVVDYSTGYSSLGAIVVDPSGHLVVTDRSGNKVYRVNEDGSKEVIAGNGSDSGGGDGFNATETGLYGVRGIWFLKDKSYLLATHEGSQIWYVDTLGIIHLFLNGRQGDEYHSGDGEHFQTPGYKISEARGISVDYDGNIIITENDAGYIRKIRCNSEFTQIADKQQQSVYDIAVYPNPFSSSVKIHYGINKTSCVRIEIYNILGSLVTTLVNEIQPPGSFDVCWDASGYSEKKPEKGIYFYHIYTDNFIKTGKLIYSR